MCELCLHGLQPILKLWRGDGFGGFDCVRVGAGAFAIPREIHLQRAGATTVLGCIAHHQGAGGGGFEIIQNH